MAARVDVGINLKETEPAGRLEASGRFNAMVRHRVRVTTVAEVDQQQLGVAEAGIRNVLILSSRND